jgi:hypothetical protein
VPVAAVSREALCLYAEYSTNDALADHRNESRKAWSRHQARCRLAEVIVDCLNVRESHLARRVRERVLATPALEILAQLRRARLANVHDCAPM